jgi:hypothetical protein
LKRLCTFAAMAALVAIAAAGCGGSSSTAQKVKVDATPVGLKHAAEATLAKGTSKVEFTIGMTIQGVDVSMKGTGAIDPANKRFTMSFDAHELFEKLQQAKGSVPAEVASAFEQPIEMLVDGTVMYMHFPALAAATGSAKEWIKIDLAAVNQDAAELLGGGGPGALGSDPSSLLQFLEGAGKVDQVGDEDVRGVHTTHFSGSYTLDDAVASLPADQQDKARRVFDSLGLPEDAKTQPIPFDAWVDDEGLVRRIDLAFDPSLLAPQGTPAQLGKMKMRLEFFDFGTPVDFELPSDDEVQDISDLGSGASSRFSSVGSSIDVNS